MGTAKAFYNHASYIGSVPSFNALVKSFFQDIDPKDQELFDEPSREKIEDNENNEDGN